MRRTASEPCTMVSRLPRFRARAWAARMSLRPVESRNLSLRRSSTRTRGRPSSIRRSSSSNVSALERSSSPESDTRTASSCWLSSTARLLTAREQYPGWVIHVGHTVAMLIETASAAETEAAGAELATRLQTGDLVLVSGELGTGKTTFVRGACRALGVIAPVTSPTFTIGQVYKGRIEVAPLDLYRLDALEPGLREDYVAGERIAFVEWPEIGDL